MMSSLAALPEVTGAACEDVGGGRSIRLQRAARTARRGREDADLGEAQLPEDVPAAHADAAAAQIAEAAGRASLQPGGRVAEVAVRIRPFASGRVFAVCEVAHHA